MELQIMEPEELEDDEELEEIEEHGKIPEGKITNSIFYRTMIMENKNVIMCTIGRTGSGKTYSNLRMLELWYQFCFKKPFPREHICFTVRQVLELLQSDKLQPGDVILWEESGKSMGSLDFQSKIAKVFNAVLQTYRKRRVSLLTNLPYLSMLNRSTRMMINLVLNTVDIDKQNKEVIIKPLWLQWNQFTGKCYKRKPRTMRNGMSEPVDFIRFGMPSPELLHTYEILKDNFVKDTIEDALAQVIRQELKEQGNKKIFTEKGIEVYHLWHKLLNMGNPKNQLQRLIGEELSIDKKSVNARIQVMNKAWSDWKKETYNAKI
jgi:hypothetical protein